MRRGFLVPETCPFVATNRATVPSARIFDSWFMETRLPASQPTTFLDKKNVLWWWPARAARNPENKC
jgi:hypothetical protein